MLPKHSQILTPHEKWFPLLDQGLVTINENANRVIWTESGRFAGALVPGVALQERIVQIDANLGEVDKILQRMGMVNNIGSLASLANIGISIAGYSLILNKLNHIERKLDILLEQILSVRSTLERINSHLDVLSLTKIQAASETLEKALAATEQSNQNDLAKHARNLFQEAKISYGLLFHTADLWNCVDTPVFAALALQARFVACAIGELQAEFLLGDEGSYRQTCLLTENDYSGRFALNVVDALRARSDKAVIRPLAEFLAFELNAEQLVNALILAQKTVSWTERRLISFADDGELPRLLGMAPVDVLRATLAAQGDTIYLLGNITDERR